MCATMDILKEGRDDEIRLASHLCFDRDALAVLMSYVQTARVRQDWLQNNDFPKYGIDIYFFFLMSLR